MGEVGGPVTLVGGSMPLLLQTDFQIDFEDFYSSIFGEGASKSDERHSQNFECGRNLTKLLGSYTKRFLFDIKSFLDLQTTSYVKSILVEAGNTTTTLTDHNRSKRDLGAIAITFAVSALLASVTSMVYYNLSYQGLVDHLKNLYRRIEEDRKVTNRIINDVKLLRNGEDELAIRANSLFEILYSLKVTHACQLLKQVTEVELTRINIEYKLMLSDLITETLSDRVVPISLLVKLSEKGLLRGSLIESDLTLFYKLCKLNLVSVDVTQETLLLTISCPQLRKQTDYLTFSILSPPLTVRSEENRFLTRAVDADFSDLTIPLAVLERANFSLANMTLDDLRQIRKTDGCTNVHNRQFCRRLLPVPPATFRCLASMTRYGGGGSPCRQLESVSTSASLANYELGRNYAVIFQPDNFDVRGNTGKLETVLHHGRGSRADKYVCLVVPSKFKTVTILGNDQVIKFSQAISFVFDSVLGFKPEDAFVTKKLFSDEFATDFKKPDKNYFSYNETAWEKLEELDPNIFTSAMNLPTVDATITTICLVFVALIAAAILLLVCGRRSMLCWRCLTSTGSWLINGRGLFGVTAMDAEVGRAKSVSPDDSFDPLEDERSTAPLSAAGAAGAAFSKGADGGKSPTLNLTLPKTSADQQSDGGAGWSGKWRRSSHPGGGAHQGDV